MDSNLMDKTSKASETKAAILSHIDRILGSVPPGANQAVLDLLHTARKTLGGIESNEWWALYGGDRSEAISRKLLNSVGSQIKAGTWVHPR